LAETKDARVLDIGRSHLSLMLGKAFPRIETMGFPLPEDKGAHMPESEFRAKHHVFDLNLARTPAEWPAVGKFDLILMAEVIEHLYSAPELVLLMLNRMLAPRGLLVVSTNNAAAVDRRLKLLLGRNPYERIRAYDGNPGHFREYTKGELIEIGGLAGLKTVRHQYVDYFGCTGNRAWLMLNELYTHTFGFVPVLRRGQTIVYQSALDAETATL